MHLHDGRDKYANMQFNSHTVPPQDGRYNIDDSRNPGKRSVIDDLTEESRRHSGTGERVPPPRYPGDTSAGRRLPSLRAPLEQALAHVAFTRREAMRNGELSDEVAQLMSQHGQIVDVMQEHDGRITENRVAIEENHSMILASDAMLNAWAEQFIVEPPPEDGPQVEVEDLEEGDFDEDPNEDPEEDDDDGDADSDILHVTIDSD
ncbi:hypothetical protein E3N88_41504 [Mikania micrantha]|uniref:Uncharacterized protein n=1 Tax=Mikania micrantha TaxID=192012 RepID=A0A5N6LMQ8_9ASTR|nr:hypothetical protein E3N88_41504 [Mikania micrantha]